MKRLLGVGLSLLLIGSAGAMETGDLNTHDSDGVSTITDTRILGVLDHVKEVLKTAEENAREKINPDDAAQAYLALIMQQCMQLIQLGNNTFSGLGVDEAVLVDNLLSVVEDLKKKLDGVRLESFVERRILLGVMGKETRDALSLAMSLFNKNTDFVAMLCEAFGGGAIRKDAILHAWLAYVKKQWYVVVNCLEDRGYKIDLKALDCGDIK